MKTIVAIAMPLLLLLALIMGVAGKGFLIVAAALLLLGAWCLAATLEGPKKRWLAGTIYYLVLGTVFFLFS